MTGLVRCFVVDEATSPDDVRRDSLPRPLHSERAIRHAIDDLTAFCDTHHFRAKRIGHPHVWRMSVSKCGGGSVRSDLEFCSGFRAATVR